MFAASRTRILRGETQVVGFTFLADDLINLDQIAIKGSHSLGFQDPRYLTGGPPGDIRGTCGELITSVDALRLSSL